MHTRTRIKICGLRTLEDALCAADAGADAVGFVFVERSPRFVTVEHAAAIVKALPAFVEPVALFADAPLEVVRATCEATRIRTVQLHGREDREYVESLGTYRVIKAVNFGDEAQAYWLQVSASGIVGVLVDAPAKPQAAGDVAALTGGGGESFDWASLAVLDRAELPRLILAGGLTPANVADAISLVQPWAVDVSSGVESSRGVKDQAKIRAFCAAVQHADARGR